MKPSEESALALALGFSIFAGQQAEGSPFGIALGIMAAGWFLVALTRVIR